MPGNNKGLDPREVLSPRDKWELVDVLHEGRWWSMAIGYWTDEEGKRPVLAQRWNGDEGDKGNPLSRGYPTWFILPSETYSLYFGSDFIPNDKKSKVIDFLLKKS
ncbi:hypothetical protein AA15237_3049 [Komagataeibacter xylinus NBRC 15237]|nr:hypothetical protein AA15237_3049 [Komagataeibacter xylinus NBRC 15237]